MHEYALAKDIIEAAKQKGRPVSITVEVGALSTITADEIKNLLSSTVSWDIITKTRDGIIKCKCGFKGEPKIKGRTHDLVFMECPKCKSSNLEVLDGDKIKLTSVLVR